MKKILFLFLFLLLLLVGCSQTDHDLPSTKDLIDDPTALTEKVFTLEDYLTPEMITDYQRSFNMKVDVQGNRLKLTYDISEEYPNAPINITLWREALENSELKAEYDTLFTELRQELVDIIQSNDIEIIIIYRYKEFILYTEIYKE